jgi:PHD/YefM family antitoxin component YafN of YafNO toxin-antitoxin module
LLTVEILSDPDMMEDIRKGLEDVKAGRITPLHKLLKEEAC